MPAFLKGHVARGCTYNITFRGVGGSIIVPNVSDVIRCRIGRAGESDFLTVTSSAPTANGSTFTKGTSGSPENALRLDDADMATLPPGTYTMYIEIQDVGDSNDWKNADRIVFHVEDTP